MEVFNKISGKILSQVSSSVSSTVSQLSNVLPGNPVTREYEVTNHIASAGIGLVWKIYNGIKRSTKQEAAIFVFEKRQLEKWNKADKDLILDSLKKGVIQLTKIRHPQILTVQHPLEESRDSLAFATEPIFVSLANVLGQTFNMPQPANMSDYKLFDIEIKYGLLQLAEGLTFLHNDMKLVHGNISPESIIINKKGAWKIFGFDFCIHNMSAPNSPVNFLYEGYNITLPNVCRPNLEYLAPEYIQDSKVYTYSDIFSFGMVIYRIFSEGNKQLNAPIENLQQFKNKIQQIKQLNTGKLQFIPEELRNHILDLLNINPHTRPEAHIFAKIPYFEDLGIKTLTYLDSLLQWDNVQKSQFYKSLPASLSNLPQRVKLQKVLSQVVIDLNQPVMVPFILPSIMDIAKGCNQQEYCMYVLPHLKPLMKIMEPIQVMLIFLQQMELLLKLTPAEDIQQHVLPMLYHGLDCNISQIHEMCLGVLPSFAGLLDHSNVKNHLLPRIKKLCLSANSLSVRVNCLLCIGGLLEHLDKWLVLDEVLAFLPQISSREPAVLMGILGIYKLALTHKKLGISKEILASRVLPFLIPLCIENGLSLTQFNAMVGLVKEMFSQVENEHRNKLEQLNAVKDQHKVLSSNMPSSVSGVKEINKVFDGLGLENFAPSNNKAQEKKPVTADQKWTFESNQPLKPVEVKSTSINALNNSAVEIQPPKLMSLNTSGNKIQNFSNYNVVNNNLKQSFAPNYSFASNYNQQTANISMPSNNQGKQVMAQNWSALDNLLPTTSSSIPKIPMNQMNFAQPLLPSNVSSNGNNGNENSNLLSKDDIMDLLS